ncbi:homoserine O-acetyltransferase family protein [Sphingobacterium spiritivorum]|uniref:homoserine O-acetyltransferase family protein n=1 Tax=Sphingobacterium spiritivorum TaxID=258 RepID=UPI003DA5C3A9
MSSKTFKYTEPFVFENGRQIDDLQIAYHTYGKLNADRDNVVWVCHALTANSDVFDWWKGLFGENDLFNPRDYFIVCANVLGSHYGSSGPLSVNPQTDQPYYLSFPQFTVRDIVQANQLLADHLEIQKIDILIGGSLGGQQALEWAASTQIDISHLIVIATNAVHSPWGIAYNESQRLAITADRTFYANKPDGGAKGLKAARSLALLSYRSYDTYAATQAESDIEKTEQYKASSYQSYQGDKLVNRFNAYSYWFLSKAMDSHHLGRGRVSAAQTLQQLKQKTLVIGITTDVLFPPAEQQFIAQHIAGAEYYQLDSLYGHDGFLIETKTLSQIISGFLAAQFAEDKSIELTTA